MLPDENSPAPGRDDGSALDAFLPRMATQVVAMAAVALGTLWLVEQRSGQHDARIDALHEEIDLLRYERDRMQRLNHELAREVHDAGVASEVARWQLRWTEERLRRTEAELAVTEGRANAAQRALARSAPESPPQAGPRLDLPTRAAPADLPRLAGIEPLDDEAARVLDARVNALADGGGLELGDGAEAARPTTAGPTARRTAGAGLEPSRFDPLIPGLRDGDSQRARDQAFLEWKSVVGEAVAGECADKVAEGALRRCENEVQRELFPYAERGVRCLLTGNAAPDYVRADTSDLDSLPTHSKPLRQGAVILCDGALTNL